MTITVPVLVNYKRFKVMIQINGDKRNATLKSEQCDWEYDSLHDLIRSLKSHSQTYRYDLVDALRKAANDIGGLSADLDVGIKRVSEFGGKGDMRLWNWIIGKDKKRRYASWGILSGLFLISGGLTWVIEYGLDNALSAILPEAAEWIIAIVICWAVLAFYCVSF